MIHIYAVDSVFLKNFKQLGIVCQQFFYLGWNVYWIIRHLSCPLCPPKGHTRTLNEESKIWYNIHMDSFEQICQMLPEGWREAAREQKALIRSRNIGTPEELLRLNFLYQTSGESYGLTAALTQISENQKSLNKTAVQKRITNSADWLKWMCANLCRQEGFIVEPPGWLKNHRVCVVDASDYAAKGSHGSDFRFHYMAELFTLNTVEMHFTTASTGETLALYEKIREHDLIIADRAYGTLKSIAHVMAHNADFVIRLRSNSFKLYTSDGEPFDLTAQLKDWKKGELLDFSLFCKSGKTMFPIRVCALAKTEEQIQKSQRQTKKANPHRRDPSELQSIWNRYVVVISSLPKEITTEQILELYRMRWQIELVFKRFKSIFGGGEFSARKESAVKAWFYGKLLIAILCETMVKEGRFSPHA